ncbi:MAG: peptide chain release factor N(5)-glutamine methyltransferase [Elusimicrobiota bacterium]
MNPTELLNYGKIQLGRKNSSDARILLEHCLKLKFAELYFSKKNIKNCERDAYQKLLNKRKKGLPTAYITGETEFMGLRFYVNKNVLIPRQETEILVEEVLKILPTSHFFATGEPTWQLPTIIDIGTGCGNIAVSLAKYIPNAKIVATDISKDALRIARKNAKLNNVSDRITFFQSDILNSTSNFQLLRHRRTYLATANLIISNPPYIKSSEIKKLQKEIQYEPKIALDGGKDGLNFYRKIIPLSRKLLKKNGFLMFEIGYHHSQEIKKQMELNGLKNIKIIKDYSQQERIIYGQYNGN